MTGDFSEHTYSAQDGLQLYYRDYDTAPPGKTPVVCLPGLTRNAKDFHDIARHLAGERRVIALDMRGRGKSAYDPDWRNYTVPREVGDILACLAVARIHQAVFLGTSRGGIQTFGMTAARPTAIKAAILVDIGPTIDPRGIQRISHYMVDEKVEYHQWDEAVTALKRIDKGQVENLSDEGWMTYARKIFIEKNGVITSDYDPNLTKSFSGDTGDVSAIDLWDHFRALTRVPILILRGENSDLLSEETFGKMQTEAPEMMAVTIKDRGHVPFLDEPECITAIDEFLSHV